MSTMRPLMASVAQLVTRLRPPEADFERAGSAKAMFLLFTSA
jgi:hypothetical protein